MINVEGDINVIANDDQIDTNLISTPVFNGKEISILGTGESDLSLPETYTPVRDALRRTVPDILGRKSSLNKYCHLVISLSV